ncbi:SAM-dependent methyltransferase [hydrothermal vent metagenome]|uniref:SAM-dependent methyltransferase n=1 Tax=hydrothermal vent metagenome TaxID=652676 RepID=A0A3B0SH83_9ZZZZ
MTDNPNKDQAEYWGAAQKWIDFQDSLDATLQPVLAGTLEAAGLKPGEAVLDIGCGTGMSAMTAAGLVGPKGRVFGADISELLLGRAKERAAERGLSNVAFECTDAQVHGFEAGGYDAVISRFGVMFFADPVAAFGNIARAVRPGGRLAFMAWADLADNPWFEIPRKAAVARLGEMPDVEQKGPNPMAFADRAYVCDLLDRAGWQDISVSEVQVDLSPPGGPEGAAELSCRVGMAARILQAKDGSDADARAIEAVTAKALEPYDTPDGIRIPAMLNLCTARRG